MLAIGALLQRSLLQPLAGVGRKSELLSLMITFGLSYVLVEIGLDVFGSQYVSLPNLQTTWSLGGLYDQRSARRRRRAGSGHIGRASDMAAAHRFRKVSARHLAEPDRRGRLRDRREPRMRCIAFAIGSSLAAAAGVLLIMVIPLAAQTADSLTILAFVVVALGGLGDYRGAVLAAFLLGITQSAVGYYGGGDAESVVPYLLFILFMILRPQGLGRAVQAQ